MVARPFQRTAHTARRSRGGGRRPPVAPPLFGGARGGRRPIVDWDRSFALGDASDLSLPYGAVPNYGGASVEAWRDDIAEQAGDLPIEFLLAWIAIESAGNPCSWTSLQEAGILQLMAGDNMVRGGTSVELQHPVPPCAAGRQTTAYRSSLSDDQAYEQVRGGLQYVSYCRSYVHVQMDMYGYNWPESSSDFWTLVKMVHVAPATIGRMLQQGIAGKGSPPESWAELMQYVSGVPASWLSNAQRVGQYGEGGGSILGGSSKLLTLGALGLGLWYLLKKSR